MTQAATLQCYSRKHLAGRSVHVRSPVYRKRPPVPSPNCRLLDWSSALTTTVPPRRHTLWRRSVPAAVGRHRSLDHCRLNDYVWRSSSPPRRHMASRHARSHAGLMSSSSHRVIYTNTHTHCTDIRQQTLHKITVRKWSWQQVSITRRLYR